MILRHSLSVHNTLFPQPPHESQVALPDQPFPIGTRYTHGRRILFLHQHELIIIPSPRSNLLTLPLPLSKVDAGEVRRCPSGLAILCYFDSLRRKSMLCTNWREPAKDQSSMAVMVGLTLSNLFSMAWANACLL